MDTYNIMMKALAFKQLNVDMLGNAQGQIIDAYRRYEAGETDGLQEALQLLSSLKEICNQSEEGKAWLLDQDRHGHAADHYPRNSWGYVWNKLKG